MSLLTTKQKNEIAASAIEEATKEALAAVEKFERENLHLSTPLNFIIYFLNEKNIQISKISNLSSFINESFLLHHDLTQEKSKKSKFKLHKFSKEQLYAAVDVLYNRDRAEKLENLKNNLKFQNSHRKSLLSYLYATTGKIDQADICALSHWLWLAKRNLYGKPTKDHLMLCIFGGQGIGKTEAIEKLISPFSPFTNSLSVSQICDERTQSEVAKNYVVFCDELAGASKTEVADLKRVITAKTLSPRILGQNSHNHFQNISTFIAASNRSIDELIRDDEMRRFYQITAAKKINWELINSLNYEEIIASIDENKEEGYLIDAKFEIKEKQKEITTQNPILDFLESNHLFPIKNTSAQKTKVLKTTLFQNYKIYCADNNLFQSTNQNFYKQMKGRGFAEIKSHGNFYFIFESNSNIPHHLIEKPAHLSIVGKN